MPWPCTIAVGGAGRAHHGDRAGTGRSTVDPLPVSKPTLKRPWSHVRSLRWRRPGDGGACSLLV